ncbi:MAG: drug/metabolite transporter (DMT)-like permease [Motiliproteus sp.]|jgi:drug/metabolite transporter (DMT)-like permease
MPPKTTGLLLSVAGAMLLSPDVLVMRWIELDHSEILFWRGLFLTFGFGTLICVRYRTQCLRAVVNAGRAGVVAGVIFAANTYCFTQSMQQTSAAAAMMIISTAPLFAALIGWLVLGERISRRTALTIACTLVGISVIAVDNGGDNSVTGNLFALGCAICMATSFNWSRLKAPLDLTPGLALGGLFIAAFALLGSNGQASPSTVQLGAIALTAAITMPLGYTLLQIAPRYISATDVSLCLLLEAIFGAFWVWLALDEAPSAMTLLGSSVIFISLTFYAFGNRLLARVKNPPACKSVAD